MEKYRQETGARDAELIAEEVPEDGAGELPAIGDAEEVPEEEDVGELPVFGGYKEKDFIKAFRNTNSTLMANLPAFEKVDHAPKCRWNHLSGTEFSKLIDATYNETVKWRKNLFKLQSGNAAKQFISELSLWLDHFN